MKAATLTLYGTYPVYTGRAAANEAVAPLAHAAKTAALVAAVPFIGLAYVLAAPFAGLAALAWFAVKAFAARWKTAARFARNVALFFAAPFVGLAYAVAFPFVGVAVLAWTAVRKANRPAVN